MSKRTLTSPYVVEVKRHGEDRWRIATYENSPRMARRSARNIFQHNPRCAVRVSGNPHNENCNLGVVFTTGPAEGPHQMAEEYLAFYSCVEPTELVTVLNRLSHEEGWQLVSIEPPKEVVGLPEKARCCWLKRSVT